MTWRPFEQCKENIEATKQEPCTKCKGTGEVIVWTPFDGSHPAVVFPCEECREEKKL